MHLLPRPKLTRAPTITQMGPVSRVAGPDRDLEVRLGSTLFVYDGCRLDKIIA